MTRLAQLLACLGATLALVGCSVSPQPEPPSTIPPIPIIPTIDIERLSVAGALVVEGEAGAVDPGGSALRVANLLTSDPPTSVTVDADGSFVSAVAGAMTDPLRLQAFKDGEHSEPLDVQSVSGILPGKGASPVLVPRAACFTVDPASDIGPLLAGATQTVKLVNDCADDTTIDGLDVRLGTSSWSVDGATLPLVVPAGGVRSFQVVHAAAAAPGDDILVIHFASPEAGIRALTLLDGD